MGTSRPFNGSRSAALALVAIVGCSAPARPTPTNPPPTPITGGFTQDDYNNRIDEIRAAAHAAPLVFVGTVTAVGGAPGVWSGPMPAEQPVTYGNLKILEGSYPPDTAIVYHPVVRGAMTADSTAPRLSPAMFAAGKTAIVFAHYTPSKLVVEDSQVGAIPHDPDNEAAVVRILSARP